VGIPCLKKLEGGGGTPQGKGQGKGGKGKECLFKVCLTENDRKDNAQEGKETFPARKGLKDPKKGLCSGLN